MQLLSRQSFSHKLSTKEVLQEDEYWKDFENI
jgi:hypothetical protein